MKWLLLVRESRKQLREPSRWLLRWRRLINFNLVGTRAECECTCWIIDFELRVERTIVSLFHSRARRAAIQIFRQPGPRYHFSFGHSRLSLLWFLIIHERKHVARSRTVATKLVHPWFWRHTRCLRGGLWPLAIGQ